MARPKPSYFRMVIGDTSKPVSKQTPVTVYLAPDGDDANDGFDRNKPRRTLPDLSGVRQDPSSVIHIIGAPDVRLNFDEIETAFNGATVMINNCTVLTSEAKDPGTPSSGL